MPATQSSNLRSSMLGAELLHTLAATTNRGPTALFLRHAERFPIVDYASSTLAELTPDGGDAAEAFGAQLAGFPRIRLFHSPVNRCRQTAERIARGAAAAGVQVELVGPQAPLGIDYILDDDALEPLLLRHGDAFVRLWFSGQIAERIIRPPQALAAAWLTYLTAQMDHDPARLDLHVSHDWNAMILREFLLGIRHEDAGWLTFLDGLVFRLERASLNVAYRAHSVTRPLPWTFATGNSAGSK